MATRHGPRILLGLALAMVATPVVSADDGSIHIDVYDTYAYATDTALGVTCRFIPWWAPGIPYNNMDDLRWWCYHLG